MLDLLPNNDRFEVGMDNQCVCARHVCMLIQNHASKGFESKPASLCSLFSELGEWHIGSFH